MSEQTEELVLEETGPKLIKKSEITAKAEELKAKRALPPKPGNKVSLAELKQWLDLLVTDEMAERVMIYMYRVSPKINRKFADPKAYNNIDVFSGDFSKFDEQYIIDVHGGGKYKLLVKDLDATKDDNGYFQCIVEINPNQYPPKLDLAEVDWNSTDSDTKRFRAWAIANKIIDETNMPVIEKKDGTTAQANTSDAMVQAMKLAMDFASKMDEKQTAQFKRQLGAEDSLGKGIGEILLEKMKQEDPNKQLTTFTTLITAMKGMQPEVKQSSGLAEIMPFFTMMNENTNRMIQTMNDSSNRMMELFKIQNTAKPEVDELDRLEKLLNVAQKIKGGGGSHVESESSTFDKVMEVLGAVAGPGLQIVSNIMQANAASKGVPIGNVGPVPETKITSMTQSQQVREALPQPMTDEQKKIALTQFAPLIEKALSNAKEGWEFAVDVENLMGVEAVAVLASDGVDKLMLLARQVPQVWDKLVGIYGEPHLTKWITDFVNYKEILAEMDKQEEGEK